MNTLVEGHVRQKRENTCIVKSGFSLSWSFVGFFLQNSFSFRHNLYVFVYILVKQLDMSMYIKNDKKFHLLISGAFDPVQLKSTTAEYKITWSETNAAFLIKTEKVSQWDAERKLIFKSLSDNRTRFVLVWSIFISPPQLVFIKNKQNNILIWVPWKTAACSICSLSKESRPSGWKRWMECSSDILAFGSSYFLLLLPVLTSKHSGLSLHGNNHSVKLWLCLR